MRARPRFSARSDLKAAEKIAYDCRTTALVTDQKGSLLAELLFKRGILDAKVLNDE